MILLAVARENNGWLLLKLNTLPSSPGCLLWTEVKAWSTIVQYCSTLVRWAEKSCITERWTGVELWLERTTSCRRDELRLSSSIRWTSRRPREPWPAAYTCLPEQERTGQEVGAELPALRLSLIRWTGRWPRSGGGNPGAGVCACFPQQEARSETGGLELWLAGGKGEQSTYWKEVRAGLLASG
jgi:hypothetical protein